MISTVAQRIGMPDIQNSFFYCAVQHLRRLRSRLRADCAVQQSDTSAFGVKHIPYEMLFTANDNFIFCNLHGDSSSGRRARPPDTRCAACLRAPFTTGAQRFAGASSCTHELMTRWDTSGVSSLRRRARLPRPDQLLLMTLSISIACAIIALQKSGLLTDITANQLSSCGLHPHSSSY